MDFVAIDFETATSNFTSLCSMGICVVKNNRITERKEIYIHPVPFEFSPYNIKIHGIHPYMVEEMPTFAEYWDEIKPYIEGQTVVAHNTGFDITALCSTLDLFNIPYPTFNYICTVKLSQKAYPDIPSHKLNNLCDELNIKFHHHQAYDDAYACAKVLLKILDDYSLSSLHDIEERFEMEIGHVYEGCHIKCKKNKKRSKKKITLPDEK